ncbi:MAG: hypothetical protein ACE15D_18735 [Candidatus Eisenbacteria bacterium]
MPKGMNAEEAQLAYIVNQKHRFADLQSAALTITPKRGTKIVIQSWLFKGDGTLTNATITFASAGADSVVYRAPTGQIAVQGFPFFVAGDFDLPVTITLAGSVGGTYKEITVGYLEIG